MRLLLSVLAALAGALPALAAPAAAPLVIADVTVIPVDTDEVLPGRTVLIRDGRIVRIDPAKEARIPKGATVVDGRGKFLVPGFFDAHVHITARAAAKASRDPATAALDLPPGYDQAVMLSFLRAGVTSVANLGGGPVGDGELLRLREEIAAGRTAGPRLYIAKRINGPLAGVTEKDLATAPASTIDAPTIAADGAAAVQAAKAKGYDFIKPYQFLNRQTYAAVVEEAGRQGFVTTGHLPELGCSVCADRAFVFAHPMSNVAHAEELQRYGRETDLAPADIDALADLVKRSGMGVTPTLITMKAIQHMQVEREVMPVAPGWSRYLDPVSRLQWTAPANRYLGQPFRDRDGAHLFSASYDFARVLTRQLWKRGVPLTVGTDASLPGLVYGHSVHQEMIELHEIGLSPVEVLRAASLNGRRLFDPKGDDGAIRPGRRADLVLLGADPLADVRNVETVEGVVAAGLWRSAAELDRLYEEAAR
ncbi:amidohydrolase family protein [Caulobacter mirabilis]|uniref:Amidohydrolase-related domain-containing protein n=1 Tax=Caulobacter mirabilis TaxID=69666 RepID=A0A2D2AUQ5_9CAUL|nr:amidohydrolase family protein [Caulobacter mirabilis]ATQ41731.1 hypothetical protein CSW64_04565 [Caulobacter mirabilis]